MKKFLSCFLTMFFLFLLSLSSNAQYCNTDVTNGIAAANITASGENTPNETRDKAFDNAVLTKWLTFATSGFLSVDLGSAKVITYYSITSANDFPGRDPKDFVLEGSNDGVTFTPLDTRTGETFASRYLTKYFSFANATAYRYYRIRITANNGDTIIQLAEIQLLTSSDCVVGDVYNTTTGVAYPNVPVYLRDSVNTFSSSITDAAGKFVFSYTQTPVSDYAVLVQPPANTMFSSGPAMNLNTGAMNAITATNMAKQLWTSGAFLNTNGQSLSPSGYKYLFDNTTGAKTPASLDWVLKPSTSFTLPCSMLSTTLDGNGSFGNLSAADYLTQHPWQPAFHPDLPISEAHPLLFKPLVSATTGYSNSNTITPSPIKGVLYDESKYNVTSFLGTLNDGVIYYMPFYDDASYNLLNGFGGGWRKTYGHTTGDIYDQYLAVNGSPGAVSPLLQFTANITSTGTFYMNCFGKNANSFVQNINAPVELSLKIYDGANQLVSTSSLTLPPVTSAADDDPASPWVGKAILFTAATTGTYTFKIDVPTTSVFGNDFYLDDIFISQCSVLSTISGNVFHDFNGLTDNTVNGTGTNAGGLNAVLVDATTGLVVATVPVNADGTFNFSGVNGGNYYVEITTNTATVGSTPPAVVLPSGWTSTGENLGTGAGSDGLVNGILSLGTVTGNVTDADFGIEQPPVSPDQNYTLPSVTYNSTITLNGTGTTASPGPLNGTDAEQGTLGTGNTFTITSVAGLNGNTLIYNGVPVTGPITITNYDPSLLQIQFTGIGSTQATFSYTVTDAAGIQSAPSTYKIDWLLYGPLPVKLVSFDAITDGSKVLISWKLSSETNVKKYEIEFSKDGINFVDLGSLACTQSRSYSFTHYSPVNGFNYYRLKSIDNDGKESLSEIKKIKFGKLISGISVYPNPVSNYVNISSAENLINKPATISLLSMDGKILMHKKISSLNQATSLNVSSFSNGKYIIRIVTYNNVVNKAIQIIH